MMLKKTIISEFFTTVSLKQALQSLYLMTFGSYKLRTGKDRELLEKELLKKVSPHSVSPKGREEEQKIISFYNGRSAIFHALKMIGVDSEDEVIVNAYNCVSVSNAVIQSGAKIVYSDIERETLSFDFEILRTNISAKTKVIIIQHTFGKQARDYKKILDFCKKENILVVEDCAHSLGNNTEILGDFAIFSTGRDKVISSITGGFLLVNNKKYVERLSTEGFSPLNLKMPSTSLILKNLNYNIVGYLAYKFYDFLKLGKIIIFLSRKLKLITEILTPNEKACNFDNFYLDFPNSLAYLALKELKKLDKYTKIRLENIKYYIQNIKNNKIEVVGYQQKHTDNNTGQTHRSAPTKTNVGVNLSVHPDNGFRFPILLNSEEEKNKLYNYFRKNKILLGNYWSGQTIIPIGTKLEDVKYKIGSCPVAEDISKRILTLPNHKLITKKDLKKVVNLLNNF